MPASFGLCWGRYDRETFGANGSSAGQTVGLRLGRKSGIAIAVGVNAWHPQARDTALRRIRDRIEGKRPAEMNPARRTFEHAQLFGDTPLAAHVGRYVGSYLGEVSVTREGKSGLRLDVGPHQGRRRTFRVVKTTLGRYRIDSEFPVSLAFLRDPHPMLSLGVHTYKKVH